MLETQVSDHGTHSAMGHAARLRIVRKCMGMLRHPERHLVLTPDFEQKLVNTVEAITRCTPLTQQDLEDYGRAGSADFEVRPGPDGRYRFGFNPSRAS